VLFSSPTATLHRENKQSKMPKKQQQQQQTEIVRLRLYMRQVAHQAGAYLWLQ